ncbi:MAG: Flp pilus assembly protein CpaB [Marinobacterium sp.]|nr:Flp pilus assembly protein CpaB [Marinobacterium sp.]
MTARKIIWFAFVLVIAGFLGVAWQLVKPSPKPAVPVPVSVPAPVSEPEPVVVEPVLEPVVIDEPENKVWALVARKALPAGTFVALDDLQWREFTDSEVSSLIGPLLKDDENVELESLSGSVLRRAVSAGEPLTDAVLLDAGDSGYLAALVRPGYRAVSVPVNRVMASSGLVAPGDTVDVILSSYLNKGSGRRFEDVQALRTRTLLYGVRVLALNSGISRIGTIEDVFADKDRFPQDSSATLEVLPDQAEKLVLATQMMASLSLSVSNPDEPGQGQPRDGSQDAQPSLNLSDLVPEVRLAGAQPGMLLMRAEGIEFIGQDREKKEQDNDR